MRKIFQILNEQGGPQGGHIFEAPDEATLLESVDRAELPAGWSRVEVRDEAEIVAAPAVDVPPA